MWFSSYYSIPKNCQDLKKVLFPLVLAVSIAFLIALQPDLGTTTLYCALVFLMFLILPISKKIKRNSIISVIAIIGGALLLLLNNGVKLVFARQIQRFNFLNPCERIYSDGNQVCNGYIAINNGGLFGKGLGNSTQKYLYLPEAYTDFIFAIVVEELGLIISIVIILLMFIVLWPVVRSMVISILQKSFSSAGLDFPLMSLIAFLSDRFVFCICLNNLIGTDIIFITHRL